MITKNDYPYYQPQHEDGTMAGGLFSFQAFRTMQEAVDWGEKHLDLDGNEDVEIREYCNDDIEGVTLIDSDENPIQKIEELSDNEIEDLITGMVMHDAGSIDNLLMCRQDDETLDQFKDRVYGEAHSKVMDAIGAIEDENEYDFSSYGGNPDTEWYDEARDGAILVVTRWMLGKEQDEE